MGVRLRSGSTRIGALLGRTPAPTAAPGDPLAALVASAPLLGERLDLAPTLRAGLCITPVQAAAFRALLAELDEALARSGRDTGTDVRRVSDDFGFQWFVLEDDDSLGDLAQAVRLAAGALERGGFGARLLCAVFGFASGGRPLHLVHAARTRRFHAFAPLRPGVRDAAAEGRVRAVLAGHVPLERDPERRYPVWGAPLDEATA